MAKIWSFPGKSVHSVLRLTQKLSSLKRVALLAKQSASANHAMFDKSVLNMPSHMMSVSVSGADFQSANVVALSDAHREPTLSQ
jgi:hypothetical protein